MFSFESFLNLPILWFVIIATAVLLYVLLDGFDLGVGVLFPRPGWSLAVAVCLQPFLWHTPL
jgi:cytochrome bd-type quinol oxidase subunit 2